MSPKKALESYLILSFADWVLSYGGYSKCASVIAKDKIKNFKKREDELNYMRGMVEESIKILQFNNTSIDNFGILLNENWKLKRKLSDKVSTPEIDSIFEEAMSAGAIGGKLLGAGGGGFVVLFVKPELQAQIRERLKG